MNKYSEDSFVDDDCPQESTYQDMPNVWQTNVVTQRRLAKLLSHKFNKYCKKGYPFDVIYAKLCKHEIQVKVSYPANPTALDARLRNCRINAIRAKYDYKRQSYFAAGILEDLQEYFYRILKERAYTPAQITAIANQLGIQLNYDDYLDWYDLVN